LAQITFGAHIQHRLAAISTSVNRTYLV